MKEEGVESINLTGERYRGLFQKIFASKVLLVLAVVIILLVFSYFLYAYIGRYERCESWSCFNENLAACKKTEFAGGDDIVFGYKIDGRSGDACEIEVEFVQGEIADRTTKGMVGSKMTCHIPDGVIMLPEADLSKCSGELKEMLQERIITQLHNYIIQNMGQINKELLNPLLANSTKMTDSSDV